MNVRKFQHHSSNISEVIPKNQRGETPSPFIGLFKISYISISESH